MSTLAATGGVPGPGRIGRVAIGDLLKRSAERFPDRVAVTDGGRRVTFAEIEREPWVASVVHDAEAPVDAEVRLGADAFAIAQEFICSETIAFQIVPG